MSRAQLTSTVEQNTGGAVSPYVAGKNFVINGDCSIAQRGTSFTSPSNAYTLDRWCSTPSAGGTTWTVSQVASFLTGSKNAIRTQRTSGQTGTPALYLGMAFETNDVIKLQGQVVTWSFYAKAGADFSASGLQISAQFYTGTGTDQGPFVGHTGEITQINTTATLSKTIANRYTYTFTVPSNATSARWNINMLPSNTASTNDYYDITNMQLEVGSVATPFSRAGGTLSGELQACQRYYYQLSASFASDPYTYFSGNGYAATTTIARAFIPLPVSMRTTPSLATNTLGMRQISNDTLYTSGTFSLAASYPWVGIVAYTHGSAVFTTGNACILTANNSTAAYVALSAEL